MKNVIKKTFILLLTLCILAPTTDITVFAEEDTTVKNVNDLDNSVVPHTHIYQTMYDDTYHWQQCITCGNITNKTTHTLKGNGGSKTYCENGYYNTMVMSYSVKFASSFYAPFREAACSAPSAGNRKSYQMDPANAREALREAELDVIEGADFLMVKPALPCLDIIKSVKDNFDLPLVTYNVSGEYSMIMAGIENGYLTEDAIMEALLSIKRAGADLIITNFAPYALDHL